MASEDLSERELAALGASSGDDCCMASVRCVVRELRRRRALDLTAEEVEALRDLLNYLGPRVLREWKTTAPGMAALDKLILQAAAKDIDWSDVIQGESLTPEDAKILNKRAMVLKMYGGNPERRVTIRVP